MPAGDEKERKKINSMEIGRGIFSLSLCAIGRYSTIKIKWCSVGEEWRYG
jgi:hypothetical protein